MHKELSDWCTIPCGYFVFYRLVKAADEMYVLLSGCPRSKNMSEIYFKALDLYLHQSYFIFYALYTFYRCIMLIKQNEARENWSKFESYFNITALMDHVLGNFFFRWGVKVAVMFVEHSVIRLTQGISVINFWLQFYRSTDHIRIILNWVIRNKSSYISHLYLSSTSNKCYIFLDNEHPHDGKP